MNYIQTRNLLESYYVTDGYSKLKFNLLTEADKVELSKTTVNKLFKSIKTKSLKVNYVGIEKTKGDITKFSKYDDISNALTILNNMYKANPSESPSEIPKLVRCMEVLKKNKNDFTRAFEMNNQIVILLYTNIVAALIGSTALCISTGMEYIKTPNGNYKTIFNNKKKNKTNLYVKSIDRFLKLDLTGELKMVLSEKINESFNNSFSEENNELLNESFLMVSATVIAIIFAIITIIREIIYFWYYARTTISDNLLQIAYFLEEHALELKNTNEKSASKQLKLVEKIKRLAEIISVDNEKSEKKTTEEIKKEDKTNQEEQNNNESSSNEDEDILL